QTKRVHNKNEPHSGPGCLGLISNLDETGSGQEPDLRYRIMVDAGLASTPDHGARLTVITLNPGSRCMSTSKTKGPGHVDSVRSSATVLATIGCLVQLRPPDYRGRRGDAFASPRLSRLNIAAR